MHSRTILFLILFFFLPFFGKKAQSQGKKKVEYELLREAPSEDLLMLRARINAMLAGYKPSGFGFGYDVGIGINGNYRLNRLYFNAGFDIDLKSAISPEATGETASRNISGIPKEGIGVSSRFYGIAGYSFYQKTVDATVNVPLGREGDTLYLLAAETVKDHRINGELGFEIGNTGYSLRNVEVDLEDRPEDWDGPPTTMLSHAFLRVGGAYAITYNTKVKTEKWGSKSNQSRSRVFFHLAVPLKNEPAPVTSYDQNGNLREVISLKDRTESKSLGFFFGYQNDALTSFNWGYGAEFGAFPGLAGSGMQNLYIRANINLGFSTFKD